MSYFCFNFLLVFYEPITFFQLLQYLCQRFLNSSPVEVNLVAPFIGRKDGGRPSGVLVMFYFTVWVLITLLFNCEHSLS